MSWEDTNPPEQEGPFCSACQDTGCEVCVDDWSGAPEWDGTIEDLTCPICGEVYGQPFEADDCCLSDDLGTHDGMLDAVYGL